MQLRDAGELLGIEVLDHVIVGRGEYYSFADRGELTSLVKELEKKEKGGDLK